MHESKICFNCTWFLRYNKAENGKLVIVAYKAVINKITAELSSYKLTLIELTKCFLDEALNS